MHYNQRLNHDKKQKEIDKLNSHNNEHRILTRATRTKATKVGWSHVYWKDKTGWSHVYWKGKQAHLIFRILNK